MKGPKNLDRVFFHCVSRVVDRQFHFGDAEKEEFVKWMRRYEEFCGVRVVTYCVMSNHFHVLVEVPKRPEDPKSIVDDEEMWRRADVLYGKNGCGTMRQRWDWLLSQAVAGSNVDEALDAIRQFFLSRMWDISQFMKGLKQRFTQWFNKAHARTGTLWESRFKSVLVEGVGDSLSTMAAYIDLNPVRAGIVVNPSDYRWCGYGEAVSGRRRAQEGIQLAMQSMMFSGGQVFSCKQALERYRAFLWIDGQETFERGPDGAPLLVRKGFTREDVATVLQERGHLSQSEALRCRVRYFTDGCALGGRAFVNAVFEANRTAFGPKRATGARKCRQIDIPGFFVLRDLRVDVIS